MIKKLPIVETGQFGPVKLTSDKEFGKNNGENLKGAIFFPTAGYIMIHNYLHIIYKELLKKRSRLFV